MRNLLICSLTLFALCSFAFKKEFRTTQKKNAAIIGTPYIIIDKSDYELRVYDDEGWYATYPAVFGSKNLGDKMMEGDRKTPEGVFHIISKRPHEKWDKMMLLDYPTAADRQKFNQRKAQGLIPRSASIGGGIGIHGTWPHDEMAVDYMQQWTNGCISLKREDMDDLYSFIPVGTRVTIQK